MPRAPVLLRTLRAALTEAADPLRAPAMQAYMRSDMPFHGVPSAELRRVCRRVFAGLSLDDGAAWAGAVLGLWRRATHREERYAAIELSGERRYRRFQTPDALPVYEEMVVTGAWWDYVDAVAIHRVGPIVRHHPALRGTMRAWAAGEDMWLRRTAIIHQNAFGPATDTDLLAACIEPSLGHPDFFVRKAIGWALRQHARTDPDWVRAFVDARPLSALSRREALKHID